MTEKLGILYFLLILTGVIRLAVKAARRADPEEPDNFEYLTVREQIAEAKATSDALGEAEQLITDMQESTADDVIVLHIEWLGRDDAQHSLDLCCDGDNTASECMAEIGEREAYELRQLLARQCAVLSDCGRHRQNHRQNEHNAGEGSGYAEILSTLRN